MKGTQIVGLHSLRMEKQVTVSGVMLPQINFALQQNYVPLFKNLVLTNISEKEINDATLRISFDPEFAKSFEITVSQLLPGVPVEISPVNITVSAEYLFSLTEKVAASVSIELFSADGLLCSEHKSADLLSYNQWTGTAFMPEMISAFITPNHPAVREITALGGEYLKKWTGDPSFTAYITQNPNNVKLQMAAVYAALQQKNIAYSLPPASFENVQRVRLPEEVLAEKCGTCLDLAVLYCACLESVGLNPLLIFTDGHAFAGCRLEDETFPECIIYDYSAITKRTAVGIDELCLVECTDFTAGKSVDFDGASAKADSNMNNSDEFQFAVDIARCRGSNIRPIPSRIVENGAYKTADYGERKGSEITSAPSEIDMTLHKTVAGGNVPLTKQMMWERKLLDLSLRNSLLNFRPSLSNVQLMVSELGRLEDEISDGREFKIMPAPEDMTIKLSEAKIYETEAQRELITTIFESEFKSRRLRTFLQPEALEKTMKKLHRDAKVSIEENGSNTLYLAMGFLKWYESDRSERVRYAPLVLVPVDIVRKVQDKSFSIRVRDEDTQMNITLLEMLRQTYGISIGGLSPLPEDESGVNLPLVFSTVRQCIMSHSRWDIAEYAFIGQFSFSRFIMWNDIRSRCDELRQNKVVDSLISGKMEWQSKEQTLTARELDEKLTPSEMAVPTSTDSSQLAAICLAAEGESFVLHGPPGTGKSQTITNMIANALYHGKSVLFIAEKMAALSVVQKRLEKIGLGPFSLELHSNKAQKRAVLSQLEETINVGRIKQPQDYGVIAEKLHSLRNELNAAIESIHKVRSFGKSVYDAIVRYEQYSEYKGLVDFSAQQTERMAANTYDVWKELVRKASVAAGECAPYADSPFNCCENREYSIEIREQLDKVLNELIQSLADAENDINRISELLSFRPVDYSSYIKACELIKTVKNADTVLAQLISGNAFDTKLSAMKKLTDSGERMNAAKTQIEQGFDVKVFDYDSDNAALRWKQAGQQWFLPRYFGQKKLIKELSLYAKSPVGKDNITASYELLSEYKALKNEINGADSTLTSLFGGMWLSEASDFAQLKSALVDAEAIRLSLTELKLSEQQNAQTAAMLAQLKSTADADKLITNAQRISAAVDTLKSQCRVNTEKLMQSGEWYNGAADSAQRISDSIGELKAHSTLLVCLDELDNARLSNITKAYYAGTLNVQNMTPAFECGINSAMAMLGISQDKVLKDFGSVQLEDKIKQYSEVISRFESLTIQELAAKLSSKIPAAGSSNAGSELGILQKAIKSGGRMMPIRKLFDSIPNLLRRICPCMLMSPISVAQYIDPSFPKFDLVIFDEASQLPTCEAVGAIARGENAVVVGDPKQLPPTSFFSANSIDEENYEKEDLESVLDDCLALSMPQKHLLWHYRSRHESLIAYSNAKYYDNKLMTFPSPNDLVSKVSWVKVDGYYDKGASKQNKAEAQAVVAEIIRRLSDEKLRRDSIGVVTFSLVQQVLIDDMLNEEFIKNPQLEAWANEMYEPILIKNLENVQGDERDIILFSVGYGPDKNGRVSMNFGPLNRDGGWRRLNVAISRSRKMMTVYSTITPDMIDLTRTRSDGVAGLKGFLEFAANGKNALSVRQDAHTCEAGMESIVAEELKKLGYDVKCNIGCSEYKIDAAIVNPDNSEEYLLGIMCDGKKHSETSTARDRAVLQPSVLKGLGWNIVNVYALDWLDNKAKVLEKIKAEADSALERYRTMPAELQTEEHPAQKQELVFEKEEATPQTERCDEYVPFAIHSVGTADDFIKPENQKAIQALISEAVIAEAPVERNELQKKVLACYGISRGSAAVKKAYDDAFAGLCVYVTAAIDKEFCWVGEEQAAEYNTCRLTKNGGEKRSMDIICPEEIANGIRIILADQISMSKADIIRETARLFGFSRIGSVIENAVEIAVYCAESAGKITVDGDKITIKQ